MVLYQMELVVLVVNTLVVEAEVVLLVQVLQEQVHLVQLQVVLEVLELRLGQLIPVKEVLGDKIVIELVQIFIMLEVEQEAQLLLLALQLVVVKVAVETVIQLVELPI